MKLSHQLFLLCCILSFNLNAQIVGGREPGESPVQEVKPALNLGGNFNGNVNTFTGTYGGSYNLGSLSTPGGLSFDLNLSYSSTKSVGGTESVSKGIPYGDGWSIDIPRISVESNSFRVYTHQDIVALKNHPTIEPHDQTVSYSIPLPNGDVMKEGDIYLHSIHISIPGKLNCNAIYKYTDKYGQSVFAPDVFESHAHIQKLGDNWEVTLDDGTKYHFRLRVVGYRAGPNKRGVYTYTEDPANDGFSSNPDPSEKDSRKASDQIIPKEQYLYWYCTKISNPNIPKQAISFYYEKFGAFNYFKEFSQGGFIKRYQSPNYLGGSFSYGDFTVYKDVLLSQVVSHNEFGDADKLILDYQTDDFGNTMLDFDDTGVERLDSLYNYKTVYDSEIDYFNDWKRYYHAAHDNFSNNGSPIDFNGAAGDLINEMSSTNPYIKNYSGVWKYKRDLVSNGLTTLNFEHSYLESGRINNVEALIPGDQYEIKTKLSGNFCNYDISIVTGENTLSSSSGLINANTYNQLSGPAKESIFSTFNSAVKWNSRGTGLPPTNQYYVYTSNYFTMPNLPDNYGGYYIQVGPANSDHVFNLSEQDALSSSGNSLSAYNAYSKVIYSDNSKPVSKQHILTHYDNVPSNFGIGMPWFMMKDIYNEMGAGGDANESNSDYQFWFNKSLEASTQSVYNNIANKPTAATGNLSEVEIIRYSKNPYMLQGVRTLKAAGMVEGLGTWGYKTVKEVKLDYEIKNTQFADNKVYATGDLLVPSNLTQHTYVLNSIEHVPTNASGSAEMVDLTNTPNNYFEYNSYGHTTYDPEWFFTGSVWLMNKTVNSLGQEKEIEYSSIQDSALYSKLYVMNSDEVLAYYGKTNLTKSRSNAFQITPIVRKIKLTDGNNSERITSYVYSWDKTATVSGGGSKLLNSLYFYEKSTRLSSIGFNEVRVIETPIQGHRNYTVYEFYSSKNINGMLDVDDVNARFGGKQKSIKKYNANDDLITETIFEYESVQAYENGFERPDYDFGYWDFDYLDYHVERTGNSTYLNELLLKNTETDVAFLAGQRFYEKDFISSLTDYNSYFRYLKKKTDKQYDPNGCELNEVVFQPEPEGEGEGGGGEGQGYVNNASMEEEEEFITNLANEADFEAVSSELSDNSPLSDAVLKAVLTHESFPDQTDFIELLNLQPDLSDSTYTLLLTEEKLLESNSFTGYLEGKNIVASDYLLSLTIAKSDELESSAVQTFLVNNSPLADTLVQKILITNLEMTESAVLAIMLTQDTLTESNRLDLFHANANLSPARVEQILLHHLPYPSETVLLQLINAYSATEPDKVMNVLNNSQNSHSTAVNALIASNESSYSPESITTFNTLQLNSPLSLAVCTSEPEVGNLAIETITEYDYYTASYDGQTSSEGYKDLMDVDAASFYLRYEPSWKLYKTKSYSPQYEGAYSEEKFYYYYDLRNYYERFLGNYNNPGNNVSVVELFLTTSEGGVTEFDYSNQIKYNGVDVVFPNPDGLRSSVDFKMRNLPFQHTKTSKNGVNQKAWSQNTFYEYNARWGGPQFGAVTYNTDNISNYNYIDAADCPGFPNYCYDKLTFINNIDVGINKLTGDYTFPVAIGESVYHYHRNGRDFYVTVDPNFEDCLPSDAVLVHKEEEEEAGYENYLPEQMPPQLDLYGAVKLHKVSVQIDTLENLAYSNFGSANHLAMYGSAKVPYFNNVGDVLPDPNVSNTTVNYEFDHFEPIYPFDVLPTKTIHRRNIFTLPVLMEDEKGLKTEFVFDNLVLWTMMDDICNYNNPLFIDYGNYYMPTSIKTYTTSSNELETNYEYYPDLSVKSITEPNQSEVLYKYNEYGNVREEWINDKLVNQYNYGFWDGDQNLNFEERAAQNFIESIHYPNDTTDEALVSKKFIDPLSRDFQTAVGIYQNGIGDTEVASATYSGQVVYDQRDRVLEAYKPFIYDESGTPFELEPQATGSYPNLYPAVAQKMEYEHQWQGRLQKAGGFGEDLSTGKYKSNTYQMLSENCFLCELDLSYQEADLIMPKRLTSDYVILKETITDEDGKTTSSYKNALGQLVATKQILDNGDKVVTLSGYDNQGNLSKVINPKNQISTYDYNMLGWMYQKETIDDGVTKYMFDKSGNVVWQQNENAAAGRTDASTGTIKPYVVNYTYDDYGRLISKGEAFVNEFTSLNANHSPLLYHNLEIGDLATADQNNPYFKYTFTNNSTYAWKAEATGSKCTGSPCTVVDEDYSVLKGVGEVANRVFFSYNASLSNDVYALLHPNLQSAYNTANKKGRIAYSYTLKESDMYPQRHADSIVSITAYNYTSLGNISLLMKQFNPNGISTNAPGLISIQNYSDYNNDGLHATVNIDINADGILDFQTHTDYDTKGRLHEIYANFMDQKANGDRLASFNYNEAYNHLSEKYLYYSQNSTTTQVDHVTYQYDVKDRLTASLSNYLDYSLYYDNALASVLGNTPNGSNNFNGNINGIKADYKLSSLANNSNFDEPTAYNYTYDKLNRLVNADAVVGDEINGQGSAPLQKGDVSYTYDIIGNLTNLQRTIDENAGLQEWSYLYNNNRLYQVEGQGTTANRNYTYDISGNLLSDDSRKIVDINYNTQNLATAIEKNQSGTANITHYAYDEAGQRIYKLNFDENTTNPFVVGHVANYYLKDKSGATLGILDYTTQKWEWYINGADRVAKVNPIDFSQPDFNVAGHINWNNLLSTNSDINQISNTLASYMQQNDPAFEQLLWVQDEEENFSWMTDSELQNELSNNPEGGELSVLKSIAFNSPQDIVVLQDTLGNVYHSSIAGIYHLGSTDTLPDSSHFWNNQAFIGNDDTDVDWDDDPFGGGGGGGTPTLDPSPISFYRYDHLGNTRVVYKADWDDATNQVAYQLQGAYDYFPYGKLLRSYQPNGERYLTTQHERDQETEVDGFQGTGLDNRGARFYDSDVARFLSLDPAAMEYPSLSDYAYVANNPIAFIDPDGQRIMWFASKGIWKYRRAMRSTAAGREIWRNMRKSDTRIRVIVTDQVLTVNGGIGNDVVQGVTYGEGALRQKRGIFSYESSTVYVSMGTLRLKRAVAANAGAASFEDLSFTQKANGIRAELNTGGYSVYNTDREAIVNPAAYATVSVANNPFGGRINIPRPLNGETNQEYLGRVGGHEGVHSYKDAKIEGSQQRYSQQRRDFNKEKEGYKGEEKVVNDQTKNRIR